MLITCLTVPASSLRLPQYDSFSTNRTLEANGSHKPHTDSAETQRLERRKEADRKLDEDRQRIKEVKPFLQL